MLARLGSTEGLVAVAAALYFVAVGTDIMLTIADYRQASGSPKQATPSATSVAAATATARPEKGVLSVDEVVALLEAVAERMGDATDSYVEEFKAEHGGTPTAANLEAFQRGMAARAEDTENAVLAEHGVSPAEYQRAVMQHQTSNAVLETMMRMQTESMARLQRHGIPM